VDAFSIDIQDKPYSGAKLRRLSPIRLGEGYVEIAAFNNSRQTLQKPTTPSPHNCKSYATNPGIPQARRKYLHHGGCRKP
jgi:hypothetical protein